MYQELYRSVIQNAWVSDDIEALARKLTTEMGIGPFFFMEQEFSDSKYRGQPSACKFKLAITQAGPIQIELIQPLTEGCSAYRDSVKPGESKLHHMCVWSKDFDRDVAHFNSLGYITAQEGCVGGTRVAYLDTRELTGYMLEIIDQTPEATSLFDYIAESCKAWDGSDPWRSMQSMIG